MLLPVLRPRDTPILDNLAHEVSGNQQRLAETGVGPLYLPPYSPNFYPIERASAKLNSRLRTAAARTLDDLHDVIRETLGQFTPTEFTNHIEAAGYENDLALQDNQMPL